MEKLMQEAVTERLRLANEKELSNLNPDFKRRWVEALRSGTWTQGEGNLYGGDITRCCLGVACEVQGVPVEEFKTFDSLANSYGVWEDFVPDGFGLSQQVHEELAALNDGGATFNQIAKAIEEVL